MDYFGHAPLVDFEDKTNLELQHQVKVGSIIPGQANPPGYFCSPDSIASYTDQASGETYIAVADQCNYRLVVYRWSDLAKAIGAPNTPVVTKVRTIETRPESKATPAPVVKKAVAAGSKNAVPIHNTARNLSDVRIPNASGVKHVDRVGAVAPSGKSNIVANDGALAPAIGKKAKKAKKEKKFKY